MQSCEYSHNLLWAERLVAVMVAALQGAVPHWEAVRVVWCGVHTCTCTYMYYTCMYIHVHVYTVYVHVHLHMHTYMYSICIPHIHCCQSSQHV